MQTIFDARTRDDLLRRVDTIQPGSQRQWGKMSAAQMLEHTARVLEMATGRKPSKQALPGKLMAWMFRKSFVGEKPFGKNAPTDPTFVITDEREFAAERTRLLGLIDRFVKNSPEFAGKQTHSFFGKMTGQEWGELTYKHIDHHLRQFGM